MRNNTNLLKDIFVQQVQSEANVSNVLVVLWYKEWASLSVHEFSETLWPSSSVTRDWLEDPTKVSCFRNKSTVRVLTVGPEKNIKMSTIYLENIDTDWIRLTCDILLEKVVSSMVTKLMRRWIRIGALPLDPSFTFLFYSSSKSSHDERFL